MACYNDNVWCYTCMGCDTCEDGCQSCNGCVQCQTCDKCMSDCNAGGQASYDGQTLSFICGNSFGFSVSPQKDVIIGPNQTQSDHFFNKAVWDEIADWISARHTLPVGYDGGESYTVTGSNPDGGSTVSHSITADVSPFKASEFNRIAAEVKAPNSFRVKGAYSTSDADGVGDLITAQIFKDLVSYANSMTVDDGACQYCVSSCDLTHNQCVLCNSSCNATCNTCNASCNGCNSCNSGQCCDDCESICEECQVVCQSDDKPDNPEPCRGAVVAPLD